MYGFESWPIKKAACWRIDVFELWCWGRLLRVPWTASRSNQSTLKQINPENSLEGLMVRLKLEYVGHLMWRADSLENTLMLERLKAGREDNDLGWNVSMISLTHWAQGWASSRRWWRIGKSSMLKSTGLQSWTQLSNWTTKTLTRIFGI